MAPASEERLTELFHQHSPRVLGYLLHRGAGDAGPDLLSETFAIAWRRLGDVPADALPWLLVVARNTLAHHWRSSGRSQAVHQSWALEQREAAVVGDVGEDVAERSHVRAALASLSEQDREVLMLIGWDGLSTTQAASALQCAPGAFGVRLHRARGRLQRALDAPPQRSPSSGGRGVSAAVLDLRRPRAQSAGASAQIHRTHTATTHSSPAVESK